jgi:acetylornithine deacetylase/succinyl-diaminopimelate desuccinylase-like protein
MPSPPTSVTELAQALVRIPSVNPDGDPGTSPDNIGEAAIATYIAAFLTAAGATATLEEVLPGRPNVIGRFPTLPSPTGTLKPRLLFAPHTDTVSVAGMTIPPFGGDLHDGKLWGRGASDTKGPMAAMLWALHTLRDQIPHLPVEVHFVGFMSEESHQYGSKHFAAHHPTYDLALVGEPTEMRVVHTHKGCLWIDVHTHGRAAHGARPELGENAITKMAKLIHALDTDFRHLLADLSGPSEYLTPSTINLGMIEGGSRYNIVADRCTLRLDIRVTPGLQTHGGAEHLLKEFIHRIDPTATLSDAPPVHALDTDPANPLIQSLLATGTTLTGAPWFCDAVYLAAAGTPAIAIGPGSIAQAHTKDEHIKIEDLESGTHLFQKYLTSL